MKKICSLLLSLCLIVSIFSLQGCNKKTDLKKFTDYSFDFFDTVTTIIGYEKNEKTFKANCEVIKNELMRYHKLYDIYTEYDGINNLCSLNKKKGGLHSKLLVDTEIVSLLNFSKEIYEKTFGKVNVAFGNVLSLWHEERTYGIKYPEKAKLPDEKKLKAAAEHTDISKIIIETDSVFIEDNEMTLDVGAVAKGYATEKVAEFMMKKGFKSYLLNVGGNVRALSPQPDGKKWKIGIENPDTDDQDNPYIEYLELSDMSLVTSGSYHRFYTVNGKNYNHIIDTDSLMPAENFTSVSVICKSSALADAFSTALFCMSLEDGKKLARLEKFEAMWVLKNGKQVYTDNFKSYCTK